MKKYLVDFKEGFLISLRAIRANKMRAILTTLGIIIGIVAVTTMSTAIVGLRQAFLESISSIGSDVLYVDKFEWFGGKDWRFYRNRKNITWEQYEFLRDNLSEYDAMAPVARTFGRTIEYEERNTQTTVVYGTIDEYIKISSAVPDEGRFINDMDLRSNKRVIVIGSDIKEALFPHEDALGKTVRMRGVPLKVIGVMEKQGSGFLGMISLDSQVFLPFNVFNSMFGNRRRSMQIAVKVTDQNKIEETRDEIRAIMRQIRKVPPTKPDDFAINRQQVFQDVYDQTVGVIAIAGILITALSLFVGAIGIMNIMFVSVTERTKEIGIRKAIGAKTWSILMQFLIESALICLIGGLIGLAISFPLSLIIDQFLPTAMPLDIVILAIFISIAVGVVSGFLPAYKASKLDPVDALRYE